MVIRFEGSLSLFFMQEFVDIDLAKEHSISLDHEVVEVTRLADQDDQHW
jgi:hypothetical protein